MQPITVAPVPVVVVVVVVTATAVPAATPTPATGLPTPPVATVSAIVMDRERRALEEADLGPMMARMRCAWSAWSEWSA
uniref:Putative secreted peptide n=1 Tax=Anopheles braziliensis TaxID=58242 RepID=A0A2M3ZTS8_9DIPT